MKLPNLDNPTLRSWGLLVLRVGVGAMMMFAHGWGKLVNFGEKSASFKDPLGVGSEISMALATSAEFFAAFLVIVGLGTRLAAVPLVFTMLMAALVIHADDPWAKKEFALLYAVPFLALIFTGPGKYSVDAWLTKRFSKK